MVHKSHPLPVAFVSWIIKSIQFRNRQNKIRLWMSFANSHMHDGYRPLEPNWPHQTHSDFHPWRICPCKAKSTWYPRGVLGILLEVRQLFFAMVFEVLISRYMVQQRTTMELWYRPPVLGLGWAGAVLGGKAPKTTPNLLAPWPPSNHLTFAFYIPHFLLDNPISISLSDYFAFEKLNHHPPDFNSYNLFLWGDAEKGKNNEYFERCGSQTCAFPESCAEDACKRCRNNHYLKKNKM